MPGAIPGPPTEEFNNMEEIKSGSKTAKTPAHYGKALLSWEVPEFEQYARGHWWYITAISIAAASVIYALYTKNFLFAFIIIILAVIIFLHHTSEPLNLRVAITELGILVNNKFYRFRDITSFWIIYEPPLTKNLYFQIDVSLQPPLSISLDKVDPLEVRRILLQHLAEDLEKKEEPLSDLLWRLLKL